jgi:hypothetical protein
MPEETDSIEEVLENARIPTSERTWQDVTDGLNRLREAAGQQPG